MRIKKNASIPLVLTLLSFLNTPTALSAAEPDYSVYARVLKEYVKPGKKNGIESALVDYRGLKADKRWKEVTRGLAEFDLSRLKTRAEELAFYINAYNIGAIDIILTRYSDKYGVESIMKLPRLHGTVWKRKLVTVGGKKLSLDDIEKGILLPRFKEPRIHFAVVCASVSCPDLRAEPYTAAQLESQLMDQTRTFLKNPSKGVRPNPRTGTMRVSELFYWYIQDFQADGGPAAFIKKHAPHIGPEYKIQGKLHYDWELNGK